MKMNIHSRRGVAGDIMNPRHLFVFTLFLSNVLAWSAWADITSTVAWAPPSTNADGSRLLDLSHYILFACDSPLAETPSVTCGGTMQTYRIEGGETQAIVSYPISTREGELYYGIIAFDFSNNASPLSNQVRKTFDFVGPSAPTMLQIIIKMEG